MIISVLVPTYRRSQDLHRCLEALKCQIRLADEILVVVRDNDKETRDFLAAYHRESLPLAVAAVSATGVIAAMNAGLEQATGDVIALVDDDASPHPDWLARIEKHFLDDEKVGGVGGRDIISHMPGEHANVGKLSWWGRISGNHHIGVGPPREVDVLKGVNCAYRSSAFKKIGFDTRMRGTGAQVHWELSLGLTLKRAGWKLIYDPAVVVDHFPAQRFDEDQRNQFSYVAFFNIVHNETLALLEHFSWPQRLLFLIWAFTIGSRGGLGVLQIPRLLLQRESHVFAMATASFAGRIAAFRSFLAGRSRRGSGAKS